MTTRRVPAAALAALCVFALVGAHGSAAERGGAARPNILVIWTDDQALETVRVMKNVAQLKREGTTFTRAYVSFPVCCPSKATLLTGQYAHNHGVLSNTPPAGGYTKLDNANTLPVWLRQAGYSTWFVGKYLNGYGTGGNDPSEIPPGWDAWHALVVNPNDYCTFRVNDNGVVSRNTNSMASCVRNSRLHQTYRLADRAVAEIRARANDSKPWFAWLHFHAPHIGGPQLRAGFSSPWPAPADLGKFAHEPLPRDPAINEADMSDKSGYIAARFPELTAAQLGDVREAYQHELETLLSVDAAIGEVRAALAATGQLDDTIIVFSSDNGFYHGQHRIKDGKHYLYEQAIHVPLVVRGPGFRAGRRVDQPVTNADLAPTIVAAARATAGRTMDGKPLQRLVARRSVGRARAVLIEDSTDGSRVGLRTATWSLAKYGAYYELYDMKRDRFQLSNLSGNANYAATLQSLRRRLVALQACRGTSCE